MRAHRRRGRKWPLHQSGGCGLRCRCRRGPLPAKPACPQLTGDVSGAARKRARNDREPIGDGADGYLRPVGVMILRMPRQA